jgi:hypothetical protein
MPIDIQEITFRPGQAPNRRLFFVNWDAGNGVQLSMPHHMHKKPDMVYITPFLVAGGGAFGPIYLDISVCGPGHCAWDETDVFLGKFNDYGGFCLVEVVIHWSPSR